MSTINRDGWQRVAESKAAHLWQDGGAKDASGYRRAVCGKRTQYPLHPHLMHGFCRACEVWVEQQATLHSEDHMTITPTLNVTDAGALLREHGYTLRRHGLWWLVRPPATDDVYEMDDDALVLAGIALCDRPDLAPDAVLAIAAGAPAAEAEELPPGDSLASDGTMPLGDLLVALEAHARALPRPLPLDHRIPLPNVPERLAAPIDLIAPGRYQPRTTFDAAKLADLTASIQEHGILTALKVFANEHGQLELIAGERRLRAATAAGLRFVPIELAAYTLRQIAEISMIDNLERADLTPLEEGAMFERLIGELGISEAELSRRISRNRAYIQQRRAIAGAAPEVIQALDAGDLTFSMARAIALAAPGEPKAQQQALTRLRELTTAGKRTTEAEARHAAEKAVLSRSKKALEALGWRITEAYAYTIIWAPSERPRPWSGAEILEAVRAGRRPAGEVPPLGGSEVGTAIATLSLRYKVNREYQPWIGLSHGWNEVSRFYAPGELPEVAASVHQELATLQAAYTAAGWTLTMKERSYGSQFEARAAQGAYRSMYDWGEAEKFLKEIVAGKVRTEPAVAGTAESAPTAPCDSCGIKVTRREYIEGAYYCAACSPRITREIADRKARTAAQVAEIAGTWLDQAPPDALRLLVRRLDWQALAAAGIQDNAPAAIAAGLRSADPATLRAAVLGQLTESADRWRVYPVIGEPAPPPAQTDDSPLAEIVATLAGVERTLRRELPPADVQEYQELLDRLMEDLEALSDAPDVTDAAYDALATRIGDAQRQLAERLVVESEVAA